MARMARFVAPGLPHHVTQRGNRRQPTFFGPNDFKTYLDLLSEWCGRSGVSIWAWCLMPNHVHLIAVPAAISSLARGIGEAHRRYSRLINFREGWRGFLWQGRFSSCPLDPTHLVAAVRYVELNPVRAGLTADPYDWPWSSARAHADGTPDSLLGEDRPLREILPGCWREFLQAELPRPLQEAIRLHSRTGRPLGSPDFLASLERQAGRPLRPGKRGPKRPSIPLPTQASLPGL